MDQGGATSTEEGTEETILDEQSMDEKKYYKGEKLHRTLVTGLETTLKEDGCGGKDAY